MLRVRFLEDVIMTDNYQTWRKNNEKDFDYNLSLELYNKGLVDVLNPYENQDLKERLELYIHDWDKFVKEVDHIGFGNGKV